MAELKVQFVLASVCRHISVLDYFSFISIGLYIVLVVGRIRRYGVGYLIGMLQILMVMCFIL